MFLDRNSFISRASRQLWPLPTFVIPARSRSASSSPQLFGSNLTEFVVILFVAQIVVSVVVWKSWRGTQEQLTGVRHELRAFKVLLTFRATRSSA